MNASFKVMRARSKVISAPAPAQRGRRLPPGKKRLSAQGAARAPSLQSHAPVEYIHGREALEYVNLHNALGAHGVHMEWAVTGKVEGGKFVPDPLVDDTFSDPVYSLGGLNHNNRCIHVQGRAINPLLEDVSDVVVALIPRPMQWAFAVYATTTNEVFGVLVKEGLLETSKHMFWDGQLQSEVISVSSGDFQIQTANELTEACSRKQYFLGVGIEAQLILHLLGGWEETVPSTETGCPALRMTGYITDNDVVVFREIEPTSASPPIIPS